MAVAVVLRHAPWMCLDLIGVPKKPLLNISETAKPVFFVSLAALKKPSMYHRSTKEESQCPFIFDPSLILLYEWDKD